MAAAEHAPGGPAQDRAGLLVSALVRRGGRRFSGTLRMEGAPGGTVVMRDGLVVAASTPAAPGPEPLLLRSGRITEADWSAAFTAGAPHGRLARELVARGLVGDAGVQVVTRSAVVDALFAMALSGVRTCTADTDTDTGAGDGANGGAGGGAGGGAEALLPAEPGLDPEWLAREIARRLAAADGWRALGLTVRSRPRPSPAAAGAQVVAERREILDRANGRRTPRDIAFATGRGLFSVMTDLATLIRNGLVVDDAGPQPVPPARAVPMEAGEAPRGPYAQEGPER